MKITHEDQTWILEGLRIISRRLQFTGEETVAIGYADASDILECQRRVKACHTLISKFENLTFEEG